MGFWNKLFGGRDAASEDAIARAQAQQAREAAAIRGRIERGEVAAADAEARSIDKGTGMYTEQERAAVAAEHQSEVTERAAGDQKAAAAAAEAADKEAA